MENWLKSVSAFANGTGGVLVFGTAEDGTVAGVRDMETASEVIRLKIEENIVPFPEIALKVQEAESGKKLLTLEVSAGWETPYYYMGENETKAYVRAEKTSIPADAGELKRLVLKGRHLSYDTQVSRYSFKDVTFKEFCVAYEEWSGNRMNDRRFENFGMVKSGRLTYAGLLFSDDSLVPHSRLVCSRWRECDGAIVKEPLESVKYRGGLIHLINKGIWFVRSHMEILWQEGEGSKTELPDYCMESVFEALVNAFAHRDYFITGSEVRLDLYDERLTISSPGGMTGGERVQDKLAEITLSVRRNPAVADIFYQIGYMNLKGRGLSRIQCLCEKAANYSCEAEPEFYSDKVQFTVTLKNLNKNSDSVTGDSSGIYAGQTGERVERSEDLLLNENEKKVLSILLENPLISTDNISCQSRIAKRTVERILQSLKKKGAVIREGSRRSGSWKVLAQYGKCTDLCKQ